MDYRDQAKLERAALLLATPELVELEIDRVSSLAANQAGHVFGVLWKKKLYICQEKISNLRKSTLIAYFLSYEFFIMPQPIIMYNFFKSNHCCFYHFTISIWFAPLLTDI